MLAAVCRTLIMTGAFTCTQPTLESNAWRVWQQERHRLHVPDISDPFVVRETDMLWARVRTSFHSKP